MAGGWVEAATSGALFCAEPDGAPAMLASTSDTPAIRSQHSRVEFMLFSTVAIKPQPASPERAGTTSHSLLAAVAAFCFGTGRSEARMWRVFSELRGWAEMLQL